jgi:hypothetical protein
MTDELKAEYLENSAAQVHALLEENGGVLHSRKATEHERLILALTSLGVDARDFDGVDVTAALADYGYVSFQGANSLAFTLLSLDSGAYPMPQLSAADVAAGKTQATREMLISGLLALRGPDGGWPHSGTKADPDLTAMALQALAPYYHNGNAAVDAAVDGALVALSTLQKTDTGGYVSWGYENSESTAQVLIALNALGIALDDERFVKGANNVYDVLISYYLDTQAGQQGGFKHVITQTSPDGMATDQGMYALVSLWRALSGESALYEMDDVGELVPWPEVVVETGVSREELAAAAKIAQALVPSVYTSDTWAKVAEALANITALLAKAEASQEEIDVAYNDLANAVKRLKSAQTGTGDNTTKPGDTTNNDTSSSTTTNNTTTTTTGATTNNYYRYGTSGTSGGSGVVRTSSSAPATNSRVTTDATDEDDEATDDAKSSVTQTTPSTSSHAASDDAKSIVSDETPLAASTNPTITYDPNALISGGVFISARALIGIVFALLTFALLTLLIVRLTARKKDVLNV